MSEELPKRAEVTGDGDVAKNRWAVLENNKPSNPDTEAKVARGKELWGAMKDKAGQTIGRLFYRGLAEGERMVNDITGAHEITKTKISELFGMGRNAMISAGQFAKEKWSARREKQAEKMAKRDSDLAKREEARDDRAEVRASLEDMRTEQDEAAKKADEQARELVERGTEIANNAKEELRIAQLAAEEAERKVDEANDELMKAQKELEASEKEVPPPSKNLIDLNKFNVLRAKALLELARERRSSIEGRVEKLTSKLERAEASVEGAQARLVERAVQSRERQQERQIAAQEAKGDRYESAKDRMSKFGGDVQKRLYGIGRTLGKVSRSVVGAVMRGAKGFAEGWREEANKELPKRAMSSKEENKWASDAGSAPKRADTSPGV